MPVRARKTKKSAKTSASSIPSDTYHAELLAILTSLTADHNALKSAHESGNEALRVELEKSIHTADQKLWAALGAWRATRRDASEPKPTFAVEKAAGTQLLRAINEELRSIREGKPQQVLFEPDNTDDGKTGPLESSLEEFCVAFKTHNVVKDEAPQWKPKIYRRMNSKVDEYDPDFESEDEKYIVNHETAAEADRIWSEMQYTELPRSLNQAEESVKPAIRNENAGENRTVGEDTEMGSPDENTTKGMGGLSHSGRKRKRWP